MYYTSIYLLYNEMRNKRLFRVETELEKLREPKLLMKPPIVP